MTIDNRSPAKIPQCGHVLHNSRLKQLESLGWHHDKSSGRHQICAELCDWIAGKIGDVEWSAWISEVSGMVYLHASPEIDKTFDAFIALVRDGWPQPKVAPVARGLFDGDDE